jgi:hypothetical protein
LRAKAEPPYPRDAYVLLLKNKYNIIIKHQTPRSPEFNLLDLGFFNCLQSAVEKQHKGKRTHNDVLARTVQEAWEQMDASSLTKIHERWKRVLRIVQEHHGDNAQIDAFRGKLFTEVFGELLVAAELENGQDDSEEDDDHDDEDDDNDDNDDA